MRVCRPSLMLAALALILTPTMACGSSTRSQTSIAAAGSKVMPFDLSRTTHQFDKSEAGGVEIVAVKDPADSEQIALIRGHLAMEAKLFAKGDYDDPARIHGMDMPGMKDLEQGAARVSVAYASRPNGAQITYTSHEPKLVDAIHAWFDRQSADHG